MAGLGFFCVLLRRNRFRLVWLINFCSGGIEVSMYSRTLSYHFCLKRLIAFNNRFGTKSNEKGFVFSLVPMPSLHLTTGREGWYRVAWCSYVIWWRHKISRQIELVGKKEKVEKTWPFKLCALFQTFSSPVTFLANSLPFLIVRKCPIPLKR